VDEAYGAQGPHDIYLSVKPARTLNQGDQDRLIAAVRATAAVVGGTCESILWVHADGSLPGQRWECEQGGSQALCPILEEQVALSCPNRV
jgi:hypothetical protein